MAAARSLVLRSLSCCIGIGLGVLACDAPDDGRAAWLQTTLVLDNQVFLDTDPTAAHAKFAKMSTSLHAFFRGTLPQFNRDLGQAGGAFYVPSAYATADTADIALVGDPHLENIGSFRASDGTIFVEFNDFDAATYGPYHWDVRRLALGCQVAAVQLEVPEPDRVAEAALAGYVAELAALDRGEPATVLTATSPLGPVLTQLVKKAEEDGQVREELDEYTRVVDGQRQMVFGELEPGQAWAMGDYALTIYGDEVVALAPGEIDLVDRIVAAWPSSLYDANRPVPAMVGVSRRLGAGVANYPTPRYYVLLADDGPERDSDVLLELKQIYDPAPNPGLLRLPTWPFPNNGSRVVQMQRALQHHPEADPWLGHACSGGACFRIRERTKYQRGVGLDKIAEELARGRWTPADLEQLAGHAGHLLARVHAQTPRQAGPLGQAALIAAVLPDADGFIKETLEFVAAYTPVVQADYALLQAALRSVGPSLGYRPPAPARTPVPVPVPSDPME